MEENKKIWTREDVEDKQAMQDNPRMHGYTCVNQGDKNHASHTQLVPTVRGWICQYCDYTQTH